MTPAITQDIQYGDHSMKDPLDKFRNQKNQKALLSKLNESLLSVSSNKDLLNRSPGI